MISHGQLVLADSQYLHGLINNNDYVHITVTEMKGWFTPVQMIQLTEIFLFVDRELSNRVLNLFSLFSI